MATIFILLKKLYIFLGYANYHNQTKQNQNGFTVFLFYLISLPLKKTLHKFYVRRIYDHIHTWLFPQFSKRHIINYYQPWFVNIILKVSITKPRACYLIPSSSNTSGCSRAQFFSSKNGVPDLKMKQNQHGS